VLPCTLVLSLMEGGIIWCISRFLAQYLLIRRLGLVVTFFPDVTNSGNDSGARMDPPHHLFEVIQNSIQQCDYWKLPRNSTNEFDTWMFSVLIVKHACTVLLDNTDNQLRVLRNFEAYVHKRVRRESCLRQFALIVFLDR
jgi:hypothetical protein